MLIGSEWISPYCAILNDAFCNKQNPQPLTNPTSVSIQNIGACLTVVAL